MSCTSRIFWRSLALALFLPVAAMAQSGLDRHLGPLSGVVELGTREGWTYGDEGGWFTLRNPAQSGDVVYFWRGFEDLQNSDFRVRTTLFTQSRENVPSHVGLMFNFVNPENYFAVTIGSDGKAYLFVRNADGLSLNPVEGVSARLDGSDVLETRVEGQTITAELNGGVVFSANFQNTISRNVGIFAVDRGISGFTDLSVAALSNADTLPTPGGHADTPLPTPGGGGNEPPPVPGGADGPPPIPGGDGGATPPPIPQDTGGATPPPIPGGGGQTPPPIPGSGGQTPPPIPNQNDAGTPPPIPEGTTNVALPDLSLQEMQIRYGVSIGIFLHEFAHAIIGETGLASTGPEEDSADSFSAFVMSAMLDGTTPQTREFVAGSIEASALLWYYSALDKERRNEPLNWQGEHAPDIRRFRQAFCIIYGSNPQQFRDIADQVKLNENARARCEYDFPRQFEAWEELAATRGRNLGPDLPGAFPANQPGGKIHLVFQEPTTQFGRDTEALMKFNNIIPAVVDQFEQYFVWPRDITVTFRECEEINAWYSPNEGTVTMCYSIIQYFSTFLRKGLRGEL